jgi:hypothetical protein
LYLGLLIAVNFYICQHVLTNHVEDHWNSIHGQWISLARLVGLDWFRPRWWPYWGGGAPLEYTYAPLIPALIAAIMRVLHCGPALALNVLTAAVYCAGPVSFYILSWRLSRLAGYSFAAALTWSLTSPAALLLPDPGQTTSFWNARRLELAVVWDDLPHLTSLALLPLAVWFLARALRSSRIRDYVLAAVTMSAMILANMFGAVLVALMVITIPLSIELRFWPSHFVKSALTVATAYLIASPWLPPSLLLTIRRNETGTGEVAWSPKALAALLLMALAFWITRRLSIRYGTDWPTRWMLLSGCIVIGIPVLAQYAGMRFLPQPGRYKVEAELAMVWIAVFALRTAIARITGRIRIALLLPLLFLAGWQALAFHRKAGPFAARQDVRERIEYQSAQWLAENLPGERVMLGGSLGNFLNTFTDVEQLSAQPYTTAPNWEEQIAVYTIYRGENAGDCDAEYSVQWLKAFGVRAVAVPGPASAEYWKPFTRPRKFEGVLPALWRHDDTTIYRVPQSSASLAHPLRPDRLVSRRPIHGLDTAEVRRYGEALDRSAPAPFEWRGPNRARIQARLAPGEIVSVQVNYHPGWRAFVGAAPARVLEDGIGLLVIEPTCVGDCEIDLQYDGGLEARFCRAISCTILLLLPALRLLRRIRRSPA